MQSLKLPAWKVGVRGLEPHSGLQVSKKQNGSSPLTRNDSILWGTSVTERWHARPQAAIRAVSSHHPQEVLLAKFSLYVHKGGLKSHNL